MFEAFIVLLLSLINLILGILFMIIGFARYYKDKKSKFSSIHSDVYALIGFAILTVLSGAYLLILGNDTFIRFLQ